LNSWALARETRAQNLDFSQVCPQAAAAAVDALEGTELDGRALRVRAYFSN